MTKYFAYITEVDNLKKDMIEDIEEEKEERREDLLKNKTGRR